MSTLPPTLVRARWAIVVTLAITSFGLGGSVAPPASAQPAAQDRKSTRLNSSHLVISYAVFCLKKKKKKEATRSKERAKTATTNTRIMLIIKDAMPHAL